MTSSIAGRNARYGGMATLADAEWGGPPDHKEALPGPPQAPGWEWELDAYGVPVPNRSTPARAARRRCLRVDTARPLPPQPALRAAEPRLRAVIAVHHSRRRARRASAALISA